MLCVALVPLQVLVGFCCSECGERGILANSSAPLTFGQLQSDADCKSGLAQVFVQQTMKTASSDEELAFKQKERAPGPPWLYSK